MITITETTNGKDYAVKNTITVSIKGYFVYAKTVNGARFFSEITDGQEALKRFEEYGGMVSYFGGGIVQLYGVLLDESDIVFIKDKVFW